MTGFNLAFKILHIKLKTNEDIVTNVIFPFNDEGMTRVDVDRNNHRFAEMGFGKNYICFYPASIIKSGDMISFRPWLSLTKKEWVSINIEDALFAVPIEIEFEAQYQEYLKTRDADVEKSAVEYMSYFDVAPQDEEQRAAKPITDYTRPLINTDYVLDDSIPPHRIIH